MLRRIIFRIVEGIWLSLDLSSSSRRYILPISSIRLTSEMNLQVESRAC